ncbi:MAG TPA: hypothetical protein V6C69_00920 [Trichormus sp.]|jgi:tetratricopeptide (TPR) repeat protein
MEQIIERIAQITFLALAIALTVVARPALAADGCDISELSLGMVAYQHSDFTRAIDHFGSAEPDHFNNPNLHYYLANCMVYLHERDSAIREYRIAYALDPRGAIGSYSKMCLDLFGIDAEGSLNAPSEKKPSAAEVTTDKRELLDDGKKILQELQKQKKENSSLYVRNYGPADFAKSTNGSDGKSQAGAVAANQATITQSAATTKSDKGTAPAVVAKNSSGTTSSTQPKKATAANDSSAGKNGGSWLSSVFRLLNGKH